MISNLLSLEVVEDADVIVEEENDDDDGDVVDDVLDDVDVVDVEDSLDEEGDKVEEVAEDDEDSVDEDGDEYDEEEDDNGVEINEDKREELDEDDDVVEGNDGVDMEVVVEEELVDSRNEGCVAVEEDEVNDDDDKVDDDDDGVGKVEKKKVLSGVDGEELETSEEVEDDKIDVVKGKIEGAPSSEEEDKVSNEEEKDDEVGSEDSVDDSVNDGELFGSPVEVERGSCVDVEVESKFGDALDSAFPGSAVPELSVDEEVGSRGVVDVPAVNERVGVCTVEEFVSSALFTSLNLGMIALLEPSIILRMMESA